MIAAAPARELLNQVQELGRRLGAEVELRCTCTCRCHTAIGTATPRRLPCRLLLDLVELDCPNGCRGERGCDRAA
jgi:hypothetical protein